MIVVIPRFEIKFIMKRRTLKKKKKKDIQG